MSGFTVGNNQHLIRANLWTTQLKEILEDTLDGIKYVQWLTEFTDGTTFNIPSIGQFEVQDYDEDQAVRYTAVDTGNFTMTVDQYKSSATYITEMMKQDSYLMSQLMAKFVPGQARAMAVSMESNLFDKVNAGQTSGDSNTINDGKHRWVATGTGNTLTVEDFARANFALDRANVPSTGRVAFIDQSSAYALGTQTNLLNLHCNPAWEGIVRTGSLSGNRFITNILGFDVYVSNYLKNGLSETIDTVPVTNGVANCFFSAESDILPIVGVMRQAPKVDSEYNKDRQRDEYMTTARWGFKLFRPENMVIAVSDTTKVYA